MERWRFKTSTEESSTDIEYWKRQLKNLIEHDTRDNILMKKELNLDGRN